MEKEKEILALLLEDIKNAERVDRFRAVEAYRIYVDAFPEDFWYARGRQ